jgi:hypothetical protein
MTFKPEEIFVDLADGPGIRTEKETKVVIEPIVQTSQTSPSKPEEKFAHLADGPGPRAYKPVSVLQESPILSEEIVEAPKKAPVVQTSQTSSSKLDEKT